MCVEVLVNWCDLMHWCLLEVNHGPQVARSQQGKPRCTGSNLVPLPAMQSTVFYRYALRHSDVLASFQSHRANAPHTPTHS